MQRFASGPAFFMSRCHDNKIICCWLGDTCCIWLLLPPGFYIFFIVVSIAFFMLSVSAPLPLAEIPSPFVPRRDPFATFV